MIALEIPRASQPHTYGRVKPEFAKNIDFLWIPGNPEWRTKAAPQLQGSATMANSKNDRVFRSAIQSYTGNGAVFSGQATTGTDATLVIVCSNFKGNEGAQNPAILGTINSRGLTYRDSTGQVAFVSSAFHDSAISLNTDSKKQTIVAVFGESYGTAFYENGTEKTFTSAGGLYNWSSSTLGIVSGGNLGAAIGIDVALAVVFNKRLNAGVAKSLSLNPWQIFEPECVYIPVDTGSAPQLLVPISDISAGSWTPSSGADLYAMLDEATYSDADYIVSSTASSCEMRVTTGSDPAVSTGHVLRYRLLAGTGSITAILKQGGTTIASYGPHTLTGSAQDFSQTLTGGEADSITDYGDLRVVFTAS